MMHYHTNMGKYKIYLEGIDYYSSQEENTLLLRGKREKRLVLLPSGKSAILKIRDRANKSEDCSEKIASELAKILKYNCAQIELAKTSNGQKACLSILFTDTKNSISLIEAGDILPIQSKKDYKIQAILELLEENGAEILNGFIKQMIFDALIGEQDRHWQNWGFILKDRTKTFAPFYDNSDSLMSEYCNRDSDLCKFDKDKSSPQFESYINRSKMVIYNEEGKCFKSFEMINYLLMKYPKRLKKDALALDSLTEDNVTEIVYNIPDIYLTDMHKDYIIKYILRRLEILRGIIYG